MTKRQHKLQPLMLGLMLSGLAATPALNHAAETQNKTGSGSGDDSHDYSFTEVIAESVTGKVYADPSKWEELGYDNLFSKGWDKPWVSPPAGGGGAPRHGWLNANDGVFYRLSLAIFNWQHGLANNSDGYSGTLTSYTPLSQRTEIRTDIGLSSNRGPTGQADAQTNFSDFVITPRFQPFQSAPDLSLSS
jgi:hypothetical protein